MPVYSKKANMSKTKKKYKRGQFRIRPESDHAVSVDINGKNFIEVTKAIDISESGIGVKLPGSLKSSRSNENVSVVITLPHPENKIFQMDAVISHLTKDRFGIFFTDPQPEVKKSIRQFILFIIKKEPLRIQLGYKLRLLGENLINQKFLLPLFLILLLFSVPLFIDELKSSNVSIKIMNFLNFTSDSSTKPVIIKQKDMIQTQSIPPEKTRETNQENLKNISTEQFYPGIINIIDINDRVISEILTVATRNGWVAIPTELCISAINLSFTNLYNESIQIRDGIYESGDTIGLWKLQSDSTFNSPEAGRWDPLSPTLWKSLISQNRVEVKTLEIFREHHQFTVCNLPDGVASAGIFLQENRIVGWSFRGIAEHGFMLKTNDLISNTNLDHFYQNLFSGKREEFFVQANLIDDPARLADKLNLYILGLEAIPALEEENTPDEIHEETIILEINTIISMLYDNSDFIDIADNLNNRSIIERLSDQAIIKVISSFDKIYGAERAIDISRNIANLMSLDKEIRLLKCGLSADTLFHKF